MLENRDASREIITTVGQITSCIGEINIEEHCRTRDIIINTIRGKDSDTPEVTADIEILDVSKAKESELRREVRSRILQSLAYPTMTSRYEDILDAHPETFEWAFQELRADQLPWSNFVAWHKTGEGVYWICGKAGSGKSTLMKYIFDDSRTRQYLASWALNLLAGV